MYRYPSMSIIDLEVLTLATMVGSVLDGIYFRKERQNEVCNISVESISYFLRAIETRHPVIF